MWVHTAKKAGKWYPGIFEAAERFMARWHVEEEKKGEPRNPDAWRIKPKGECGGSRKRKESRANRMRGA